MSSIILKEHNLYGSNLVGIGLGFTGLIIVFSQGLAFTQTAWVGVIMVLVGATVQATGAVLLKQLQPSMSSLSVATGGLLVATSLFIITFLLWQEWPEVISDKTLYSSIYLGIFGSSLGFTLPEFKS
ncbi:MAG: EamA family transporter [Methylococcales bacterium]|nr:EamA family transporter [Methylococcales bacterium]